MAREKTEAEIQAEEERAKRFKDGKITHYGMVKTIQEGGGVIHNGVHYGKVEDLPDEATLAEGDAAAAAALNQSIDAQIAALTAQKARASATLTRAQEAEAEKARKAQEDADAKKAADEEAARKAAEPKAPPKK